MPITSLPKLSIDHDAMAIWLSESKINGFEKFPFLPTPCLPAGEVPFTLVGNLFPIHTDHTIHELRT